MTFPGTANWRAGDPGAGWFQTTDAAGGRIYASQGRSAVKRVQARLNAVLGNGSAPLTVDGNPGARTVAALLAYAQQLYTATPTNALATLLPSITTDAATRSIGWVTWTFALALAYLEDGSRWTDIVQDRSAVLPQFGVAPADDYGYGAAQGGFSFGSGDQVPAFPSLAEVRARATGGGGGGGGGGAAIVPVTPVQAGIVPTGDLSAWWAARSPGQKFMVIAGAAGLGFVLNTVIRESRRGGRRRRRAW